MFIFLIGLLPYGISSTAIPLPACPASVFTAPNGAPTYSDSPCKDRKDLSVNSDPRSCQDFPHQYRELSKNKIEYILGLTELWDEEIAFKLRTKYPHVLQMIVNAGLVDYWGVKQNSSASPHHFEINGDLVRNIVALSMFDHVLSKAIFTTGAGRFRQTTQAIQSAGNLSKKEAVKIAGQQANKFNPALRNMMKKVPFIGRNGVWLSYAAARLTWGWLILELFVSGTKRLQDQLVDKINEEPLHIAYMQMDAYNEICALILKEKTADRIVDTLKKNYKETMWWHIDQVVTNIRKEECFTKYQGEAIIQGRADPYCGDLMRLMKAPSEQRYPVR